MLEGFLPYLTILVAWFASLLIPLFLIPQALLRLGLREVWARAFGWLAYVILLPAIVILGPFQFAASAELILLLGLVIAFVIFWDLRRARRAELAREP